MSFQTSKTFSRLNITNNEEFTIPETASLFCAGGGIFRNGIAVGNNNSIIPGSIRFTNNQLQYRTSTGWVNITGLVINDNNLNSNNLNDNNLNSNNLNSNNLNSNNLNSNNLNNNISNIKENSITKFGSNGELKDTSLYIENSNITGVELLETEYIVPPENKNLIIGNIQWPTTNGNKNHTLRFLSPGILEPSQGPVPIYDESVGINKLIYFENKDGKLSSSNISVLNEKLTEINGKLNIVNTKNGQKINFLTKPPQTSISQGKKGDFAWDENYIYMCVSNNIWKRTLLSSW
jgi:hypothetical protein